MVYHMYEIRKILEEANVRSHLNSSRLDWPPYNEAASELCANGFPDITYAKWREILTLKGVINYLPTPWPLIRGREEFEIARWMDYGMIYFLFCFSF